MAPATERDAIRTRWVRACVIGELFGFVPPALTGVLLVMLDAHEVVVVFGLVAAGVGEGVVLGLFQSAVMRDVLPDVSGWVAATAVAAGLAWLAGMGGSSLVQAVGPFGLLIAAPGWVIGLLSMGYLQWRRLRHAVERAGRWVPVTTFAWLFGVTIPVVALSVMPNGWPTAAHALVGLTAAIAMGATVGAITGSTLERFARQRVAPSDLAEVGQDSAVSS